eukprot:354376-Chlamydomonas_euryale.AAC.3
MPDTCFGLSIPCPPWSRGTTDFNRGSILAAARSTRPGRKRQAHMHVKSHGTHWGRPCQKMCAGVFLCGVSTPAASPQHAVACLRRTPPALSWRCRPATPERCGGVDVSEKTKTCPTPAPLANIHTAHAGMACAAIGRSLRPFHTPLPHLSMPHTNMFPESEWPCDAVSPPRHDSAPRGHSPSRTLDGNAPTPAHTPHPPAAAA